MDMNDSIRAGLDSLAAQMAEGVAEIKPRLRGWLHLASAPLTLAAGVVLIALSPTAATRFGSAVYVASAVLLFTVSAVYHRGHWSIRVRGVLRRLDHANIFVLIAGTYTPYCLLLLRGTDRVLMLIAIWAGALARRGFPGALDRRATTAVRADLLRARLCRDLRPAPVRGRLAAARGRCGCRRARPDRPSVASSTSLGGVVYGVRRPDPWPRYFGFHEVFHSLTVLAFVAHYVGVSLATYSLR